jgi:hypothetical protein
MSYQATNVATIPDRGFKWYLIFLEKAFEDELRKEIENSFETLGREAGEDALVVKGFDATRFRESIYETPAFNDEKWRARAGFPSLIVLNKPPREALSSTEALENAKVMIFPLKEIFREEKSLSDFFSDLVGALRNPDAVAALDQLEKGKIQRAWGWLGKYVKIEPSFFGFKADVNRAISDLLAR